MEQTRTAYDGLADTYAAINAEMPEALVSAGKRFVTLVGPGACVLDPGCSAGRDMAWRESRGLTVLGADLSGRMLGHARRQASGPLLQVGMSCLSLRGPHFQGVWCCASLLHLPKCQAPLAIAEMRRVRVPGGVLFLALQQGTGETWEPCPYAPARRLFARYSQTEAEELPVGAGSVPVASHSELSDSLRWLHLFATTSQRH